MSFYLFFLCGISGGILGGMGMGGGTLLIPLLTTLCGVSQRTAQGVNLLAFLPMAAAALTVHSKNGLLEKQGLLSLTLPALLFSALFSVLAFFVKERFLSFGFGLFLTVLSLFQLKAGFSTIKIGKKFPKN